MNQAVSRTDKLERKSIDINKLEPNPDNPNEMNDAQFNMLYDNIETMGMTDPLLVRPHPDKKGMFRIVGGEHRWEVAKLLDFKKVPCTIVSDEEFDADKEKFQIVRHNIIHGQMTPEKFMKLYQGMDGKYDEEIAAEMFGFVDAEEFQKLIRETAQGLPKELQQEFKDAASEIRTIEDLATILNKLFSNYGDTLQYGYMIFDFEGKESVWLRLGNTTLSDIRELGKQCVTAGKSLDGVVAEVLHLIAKGIIPDVVEMAFDKAESVDLGALEDGKLPTLDFLDD